MTSTIFFRFFDPLPPRPHLELIYTTKFKQPPLLRRISHDPRPLRCGHLIWMPPSYCRVKLGGRINGAHADSTLGFGEFLRNV